MKTEEKELPMNKIIFDELTGIPTLLATNRAKRTDQTGVVGNSGKKPDDSAAKVCSFCKGNEGLTPPSLYQDADDWNVRVFTNKFPLVEDHEVIVHSPDHNKDIEDLSHEQVVKIIRAMLNRMPVYTSQNKEVMIFNNKGGKAGASLLHPHSQMIALKGFPGVIELEKNHALRYFNEHTTCYWCDLIKTEIEVGERVVFESKHFVLIVPNASRWSYEMLMIPKEHRPNFEYISEMEINDFARMLICALRAYKELLGNPDRNFWIHTQRFDPYHWHMGLIPQTKVLGGLELGAGIWVSDKSTPEDAAKILSSYIPGCYENEVSSIGI